MLIRVRRASDPQPGETTPETRYLKRRELLRQSVLAAGTLGLVSACGPGEPEAEAAEPTPLRALSARRNAAYQVDETPTDYADATRYNNFYEFGTDKGDPARYAHEMVTEPWTVSVSGRCRKPGRIALEDLIGAAPLEDRLYRHRCVEAWSMVIPWIGLPLGGVLDRFEPEEDARFVEFKTLLRPEQMRGQRARVLDFPYVEGLRMDEAMHPLAFLAVGMYGRSLPNQNGAPLRLVVPWKYGFKGIKSIVSIRFTDDQPDTTWNLSAPHEYGFYSNVNPDVAHPRWSQKRERRIGELLKRPTLPFNGYADDVARLYAGMDLRKQF